MSVYELRRQFKSCQLLQEIKQFLEERGLGHTGGYFHYTTLTCLKNMLKSRMLYLSLGRAMNDLREPLKCDPQKWKRLYVMSFSYSANESMAMWNIYGNPLDEALRLEFSIANIANLVSGRTLEVYQITDDKNCMYPFLCKADTVKIVDIGYLCENNTDLRWNQSVIHSKACSELREITSNSDFAGLVKNIAWEYESETRLIVELPPNLKEYPDRIAIGCKNLWHSVNILCGPCLDRKRALQELQEFYDSPEGENAHEIQLDEKHIVNSKSLWKVHFKHKCKDCKTCKLAQCLLQKNLLE